MGEICEQGGKVNMKKEAVSRDKQRNRPCALIILVLEFVDSASVIYFWFLRVSEKDYWIPLLHLFYLSMKVKVAQLCPTLWDTVDYTVNGLLQARILGWVAFPFSRVRVTQTQGINPGLLHCRRILYQLSHQGSYLSLSHGFLFCFNSLSPKDQCTRYWHWWGTHTWHQSQLLCLYNTSYKNYLTTPKQKNAFFSFLPSDRWSAFQKLLYHLTWNI